MQSIVALLGLGASFVGPADTTIVTGAVRGTRVILERVVTARLCRLMAWQLDMLTRNALPRVARVRRADALSLIDQWLHSVLVTHGRDLDDIVVAALHASCVEAQILGTIHCYTPTANYLHGILCKHTSCPIAHVLSMRENM